MEQLVNKYAKKLIDAGLAEPGSVLVGGLDADLVWNTHNETTVLLEDVFEGLNINSLVFSRPAEPYGTIIDYLARGSGGTIYPNDCETRTFLHDLPVSFEFSPRAIIRALKYRKGLIIPGAGVVTFGTVSPEQGFVTYSSVCFACFVKFFADYLRDVKKGRVSSEQRDAFHKAVSKLDTPPGDAPELMHGPFTAVEEVHRALCEAGRRTVEYRLVDSYFGNISYLRNDKVYISQTGSSLDDLEGCIDPCPVDGTSCAGLTASSELGAHLEVFLRTKKRAILHGHPKFAVILSMDCDREDCDLKGQCHIKCTEERFVGDIPIVPGEVGTGPFGLCHTLPRALSEHPGGIVWGHGLFTTGDIDFNEPFGTLLDVENMCREEYFDRVGQGAGF